MKPPLYKKKRNLSRFSAHRGNASDALIHILSHLFADLDAERDFVRKLLAKLDEEAPKAAANIGKIDWPLHFFVFSPAVCRIDHAPVHAPACAGGRAGGGDNYSGGAGRASA